MTTNNKGDIGETEAIAAAAKNGFTVLLPIGGHKQYDLVIEKDGKFQKIQVKYSKTKDNTIRVNHYHNPSNKKKSKNYDASDIDAIVVFNRETDKCYFIPESFFADRHILKLRISEPKKKNNKIVWAKNFEW